MKREYINMVNELIEDAKKLNRFNIPSREFKEFENAIEDACERQIPREGIDKFDYICPYCEGISEYQNPHCPECGQKLTWGKE